MAVQKNFTIRNGLEVNNNLLVADSSKDYVGIGTSSPKYTLEVIGGIGVTYANILGIATVGQEFNVGTGGTVITSLDTGLTGFGTAIPAYVVDIRSPVSTGQTALYVQGDVRVTGDLYADDIALDQATFNNIEVSGVGTIRTASIDLGYVKTGIVTNLSTSGIGTINTASIDLGYVKTGIVTNLTTTGIASISTGIITTLSGANISYSGIGSFGSVNANTGRINTGIVTNLSTSGIASVNSGVITSAYVTTGIVTTLTGTTLNYTGIGTIATFKATNATVSGLTTTGSLSVDTGFDVYAPDSTFHGSVTIDGNLSIGGTSAILNAVQVRVADKDIILGFTTTITPSDDTANHGGVAVASTEGYPLVSLAVAGINTLPDTYKQIMWVKRNTMGTGTTDAFLFNYAVGIGSTQIPNGARFAVSGIQFTDSVINTPNLNASGVTTSNSYNVGGTQVISSGRELQNIASLDATTTATIEAAIANAPNTFQDIEVTGIATVNVGVFTSLYSPTGIITTLSGTNLSYSGIATASSFVPTSGYIKAADGTNSFYIYSGTGNVAFQGTIGASQLNSASGNKVIGLAGTDATFENNVRISGITTIGSVVINAGIVTAASGIVTYYGDGSYLTGNARNLTATIGVGTIGGVAGYGVSFIQFAGPGVSTVYYNGTTGIATVTITGGGSGSASIGIGTTPGEAFVGIITSGNLWYNSNLGRMFIYYQDQDSAQWVDASPSNVGIITSLTNVSFAPGSSSSPSMYFVGDSQTGFFSPGGGQFTFVSLGSSVLNVNQSGIRITGVATAQDFDSLSDIRYKENINTVDSALLKVDQLRGVKFNWKESGQPSYGVIAQELEEVLPELVHGEDPKTVNYNGIIGVLIEAIKELKAEIEELKNTK